MSVTRIICFGGCGFPIAYCNCPKKDNVIEPYPKNNDFFNRENPIRGRGGKRKSQSHGQGEGAGYIL